MSSLRSSVSNGTMITQDNGNEYGKLELDPQGSNVGFTDWWAQNAQGTPDPMPDYGFEPFETIRNGQLVRQSIDGISVPAAYFDRMTEFAFQSVFGIVEQRARISIQRVKIGEIWRTVERPNHYSYNSSNRNPNWVYDADGNITYDTAGRLTKTTERKLDDDTQFDPPTQDYFDGDGQLVKRITNVGSTTPAERKFYFIRSSVLNKVVSETDAAGKKVKTFVPANGTTLAQQSVSSTGTETLTFFHQDASGTGAQETMASGALVGTTTYGRTAEHAPLGRNIADIGHYITLNTAEPADEGGTSLFGSGEGYRPGRNTYAMDGISVPEDHFMMMNSGLIGV